MYMYKDIFILKLIFMEIMDVQFAYFVYINKPAMN